MLLLIIPWEGKKTKNKYRWVYLTNEIFMNHFLQNKWRFSNPKIYFCNLFASHPQKQTGCLLQASCALYTINKSAENMPDFSIPLHRKHFILVKSYNLNGRTLPMQCSSLEANTEKQSLHLTSSSVLLRSGNKSLVLLAEICAQSLLFFPRAAPAAVLRN